MRRLFSSARLRLTLSYTLFFAIVIILFSGAFYGVQIQTIRRSAQLPARVMDRLHRQLSRLDQEQHERVAIALSEQYGSVTKELQERLVNSIILFDLVAIMVCFVVSYLLAGLSLQPLERAYELQRQFLQDASHELRTPLSVMRTEVDVALRGKKKRNQLKLLKSLQEEMHQMTQLVEGILHLVRHYGSDLSINEIEAATEIDLSLVIKKVTRKFSTIAREKKIKLLSKTEPLKVVGSVSDWEKVCQILIDNAIKYTPSGGQVKVSLKKKGRQIQLTVTDTGLGISKQDQEKIFDRFYRADHARATNGNGLGLAIAKSIADRYGASLSVSSQLGQGSTFTILV